jgi:hypothetical protein
LDLDFPSKDSKVWSTWHGSIWFDCML